MKTDQAYGVVPVYLQDNQPLFLLVQQSAEYWSFPKGHMESGEVELETARRELFEETGVQDIEIVDGVKFSCQYELEQAGEPYLKTNRYFLGLLKSKDIKEPSYKPNVLEIKDVRLVTFQEARDLLVFRPFVEILDQAKEYLDERSE